MNIRVGGVFRIGSSSERSMKSEVVDVALHNMLMRVFVHRSKLQHEFERSTAMRITSVLRSPGMRSDMH